MSKFTCPYCIRTYNIKEVLWVCPDCQQPTAARRFGGKAPDCQTANNGIACYGKATVRQCPFCRQAGTGIIPKTALETPNLPFSIIGVSGAGKTNYITVMLHELENATDLGLALAYQNQETKEHQREMEDIIYNAHSVVGATASGEHMPQIWEIGNLRKRRGSTIPAYTFTIFDGAGEDHEHGVDPNSTECRYIDASQAIMLVIDPLQLEGVRSRGSVDPEVLKNSLSGRQGNAKNASDVIVSVINFIKAARDVKATKALDIPVAVVLTKFDTLLNHPAFGPQAVVKRESKVVRDGRFDLSEVEQAHAEIENWLLQIGEGAFTGIMKKGFTNFRFFGVSALGAPPTNPTTVPEKIRPHRVLDPLLWLFHNQQFID